MQVAHTQAGITKYTTIVHWYDRSYMQLVMVYSIVCLMILVILGTNILISLKVSIFF